MTTEAPERVTVYPDSNDHFYPARPDWSAGHWDTDAVTGFYGREYIRSDIAEAQLAAAREVRPFTSDDLEKIRNVISFFVHHPLHQDRETAMKRRANEILSALSEQEGK